MSGWLHLDHCRYHRKLVKALATERKLDSFRFDFAHAKYNQPGWVWHMAKIQRDVEEIRTVVKYLEEELGYRVDISKDFVKAQMYRSTSQADLMEYSRLSPPFPLVIGHSKAGLATWAYLAQFPNPPKYFINLSSRYNMREGGKREYRPTRHVLVGPDCKNRPTS